MSWTEQDIRAQLEHRRVLIIEDDIDLAPRIRDLFLKYGVSEVEVRRCVEGPKHGGLDALCSTGNHFDLICVDTMLPWDEDVLARCDALVKDRAQMEEEIGDLQAASGDLEQIKNLRQTCREISDRVAGLIDNEAGMKMIRTWNQSVALALPPMAAVLFLTARQKADSYDQESDLAKHTRWVTKPARGKQVMMAAAELLSQINGES